MNWYLGVIKKYTVFSGRARRKEFWMYSLISWIFCIILMCFETFVRTILNIYPDGYILSVPFYLILVLLPGMAVSVRRLHDIDRSGWKLIWALVPGGFLVLFAFFLQKGNIDSNQYGSDPKTEG